MLRKAKRVKKGLYTLTRSELSNKWLSGAPTYGKIPPNRCASTLLTPLGRFRMGPYAADPNLKLTRPTWADLTKPEPSVRFRRYAYRSPLTTHIEIGAFSDMSPT